MMITITSSTMTRSSDPPSDAPMMIADLWDEVASGADELVSGADEVVSGVEVAGDIENSITSFFWMKMTSSSKIV